MAVSKKKNQDDAKIRLPDQSSQTHIGDVSITGSVGSGAVISGSQVEIVNIAGGNVNGDIYLTSKREVHQMNKVIEDLDLSEDEREFILQAVGEIETEIQKGSQADEVTLKYLFNIVRKISPDVNEILIRLIINREDVPNHVKRVAKGALKY